MSNPDPPGTFEPADLPHALAQIARLGEVLEWPVPRKPSIPC